MRCDFVDDGRYATDCGPACQCVASYRTLWVYTVEERYNASSPAAVAAQCACCHAMVYFRLDEDAPALRAEVTIGDVKRAHYAHVIRQPRTCRADATTGAVMLVDCQTGAVLVVVGDAPEAYDWAAQNGYRITPGNLTPSVEVAS
jgi:hypothetical protein